MSRWRCGFAPSPSLAVALLHVCHAGFSSYLSQLTGAVGPCLIWEHICPVEAEGGEINWGVGKGVGWKERRAEARKSGDITATFTCPRWFTAYRYAPMHRLLNFILPSRQNHPNHQLKCMSHPPPPWSSQAEDPALLFQHPICWNEWVNECMNEWMNEQHWGYASSSNSTALSPSCAAMLPHAGITPALISYVK